jgi:hypothetical protein
VFVDGPQFEGRVWKGCCDIAQERAQLLREVRLGLRISLHMACARHQQAGPEAAQVGPTELTSDKSSEALADPAGHCAPTPAIALRR